MKNKQRSTGYDRAATASEGRPNKVGAGRPSIDGEEPMFKNETSTYVEVHLTVITLFNCLNNLMDAGIDLAALAQRDGCPPQLADLADALMKIPGKTDDIIPAVGWIEQFLLDIEKDINPILAFQPPQRPTGREARRAG